jgi:hypothetical protein
MNRLSAGIVCLAVAALITGCSLHKQSPTNESANRSAPTATKEATPPPAPAQAGDLQAGQASGSYTADGKVVELKYAYAGRAVRFGDDSLVVLLTEQPIPADAVAEEIKSTPLLEGEKIRGLEYVLDENSMWVRFHPSQYQESGSNKLKEFKVENGVVRGVDDNRGDLNDGKYARSVKFVATIAK